MLFLYINHSVFQSSSLLCTFLLTYERGEYLTPLERRQRGHGARRSSAGWASSRVPRAASLHITPCDAHAARGRRFQSLQCLFARAPLGGSGVVDPSLILLNAFGGAWRARNLSHHPCWHLRVPVSWAFLMAVMILVNIFAIAKIHRGCYEIFVIFESGLT